MSKATLRRSIENLLDGLNDSQLQQVLDLCEKLVDETPSSVKAVKAKVAGDVEIKPEAGGNARLKVRGMEMFFSSQDLERVSGICMASESPKIAAQEIFTWMTGNRIDIINNGQITGPKDKILQDLCEVLKH